MTSKTGFFMVVTVLILLLAGPAGWGGGAGALAQEKPEGEHVPDNYTLPFSGFGTLDELSKEGITLDDSYYNVSRSVRYYDKDGNSVYRSSFKPGNFIGFVLGEDGEIIQLWLLKKQN